MEDEYPIIWKRESCLRGECDRDRTQHWWSLPFSEPEGLTCECFHCHKSRLVEVEHEVEDIWVNNLPPSDYVEERLKELNDIQSRKI